MSHSKKITRCEKRWRYAVMTENKQVVVGGVVRMILKDALYTTPSTLCRDVWILSLLWLLYYMPKGGFLSEIYLSLELFKLLLFIIWVQEEKSDGTWYFLLFKWRWFMARNHKLPPGSESRPNYTSQRMRTSVLAGTQFSQQPAWA